MNSKHTKEQAREFLKQEALKEINEHTDFIKLQDKVFCVFAKYGLQLKAKKEKFLIGDEWNDPASKDMLMKRITQFLNENMN